MRPACFDFATLVAYWLGEVDAQHEAVMEEHYLGCASCAARLEEVEALATGVKRAFVGGFVHAVVTPAFTEQMRSRGLRLREYRVAADGSVNCSVAPEDDILLSRLQAPLEGVQRVDVIVPDPGHRMEDVPFDAQAGEVVVVPGIAHVRTLPAHQQVLHVLAVGADGERLLGTYTFNHSPHS